MDYHPFFKNPSLHSASVRLGTEVVTYLPRTTNFNPEHNTLWAWSMTITWDILVGHAVKRSC